MHSWARNLFILVVSVLGIGQMIAACGQKGDLYLPEPGKDARAKVVTATEEEPAPGMGAGHGSDDEEGGAAASEVP